MICRFCKSCIVVKYGVRHNKRKGKVQRYLCKKCNKTFVENVGYLNTSYDGNLINIALDLYFKGLSLRKIQQHFKQFYNVNISHVTILYWIRKYSELLKTYTDQFVAKTGNTWHADETALYFNGHAHWMWNAIDSSTKLMLGHVLSKDKWKKHAVRLFEECKERTEKDPLLIITDGYRGYTEIMSNSFPDSMHERDISFKVKQKNAIVERLNGTVKERYKVMRGFSRFDSAKKILNGFEVYYNFIRPHMALNGDTPANAAGIEIGKEWKELIKESVD